MKSDEDIIAEAVRIEYEEKTGKLFIVFEIKNEQYKQKVLKTWTDDVEYRIVDKNLILNKET